MAFSADKVVAALEYDFRPHVEAWGCTPEPSDDAVRHFQFKCAEAITDMPSGEDIADMTEEEFKEVSARIVDAVAELTQGQPTRDEIDALPYRIQRAYISWLRDELTNPEAPSAATKPLRAVKTSGALTMPRAGT